MIGCVPGYAGMVKGLPGAIVS
jgi:hypothetical protein